MQVAYKQDDKYSGAVVGTFAALTYKAAVKFKVQYVAGFSDDVHGYSYLLAVQPRAFDATSANPSSETESKLIQVFRHSPLSDSFIHAIGFSLQTA